MEQLRRTIRDIILQENACSSLNKNIARGIDELERSGLWISSLWKPQDYDSGIGTDINLEVMNDSGEVLATWVGELQVTGQECLGAFQCTGAYAMSLRGTGVGALLYDVAVELVGDRGLSSDRIEVDESAWKMWKYMTKNDQTYDIKGTYDWDTEQTPDDDTDDCYSNSWEVHADEWQNPQYHPLNQVFVKKDKTRPTIKCLEEKGLIVYTE